MKKITFLLFAVMATMFCSCNSDDDNSTPESSRFVYSDHSMVVSISGKQNFGITIYKDKEWVYQNLHNVTISGDYPIYTYTYGNSQYQLKLTCSYSNPSTFTAVVDFCNIVERKNPGQIITLPSPMLFKADNRVLDANGDGILDE